MKDTRNIVDMLIDPEAVKDKRDHWDHAVNPAIIATILHLLYSKPVRQHTLEGAAYFLADAQRNVKGSMEEMRTTGILGPSPPGDYLDGATSSRSGQMICRASFPPLWITWAFTATPDCPLNEQIGL